MSLRWKKEEFLILFKIPTRIPLHETWWLWYRWMMVFRFWNTQFFWFEGPIKPTDWPSPCLVVWVVVAGLQGCHQLLCFWHPHYFTHTIIIRTIIGAFTVRHKSTPLLPRPLHGFDSAGYCICRLVSMTSTPIHGWIWLGFLTIICLYFCFHYSCPLLFFFINFYLFRWFLLALLFQLQLNFCSIVSQKLIVLQINP